MGISVEQYNNYNNYILYMNLKYAAATLSGSQYSEDFNNSGKILQIPIVTNKSIYITIAGNYTYSIMLDGTIVSNATKCLDNGDIAYESLATSCMEIEDGDILTVDATITDAIEAIEAIETIEAIEVPTILSIDGMHLHKGCLNLQYVKKIYGCDGVVKLDLYKDKECSPSSRIGTIHINKDSIDWDAPVFTDPTTL